MINFVKKIISYQDIKVKEYTANISYSLFELQKKILFEKLKDKMLNSDKIGITDKKYSEHDVTVSLTTYGERIYDSYLAIQSIMEQTIKPNKIILWLAEDEFDHGSIPHSLLLLEQKGLTIKYCKDIRQYKKLIPTLINYPDDIIITIDDDVLYQYDLIENLLRSYKEYPNAIHFCRGSKMFFNKENELSDYINWPRVDNFDININNFPTGIGGILYPPHSLHEDVINDKIFMDICPTNDDIWFKAMAVLKSTMSRKAFTRNKDRDDFIDINGDIQKKTALYNINVLQGKNNEQIRKVFSYYNIYRILSKDR